MLGDVLRRRTRSAVVSVDKSVYIGPRDVEAAVSGQWRTFVASLAAVRIWNLARHADSEAGCGGHGTLLALVEALACLSVGDLQARGLLDPAPKVSW